MCVCVERQKNLHFKLYDADNSGLDAWCSVCATRIIVKTIFFLFSLPLVKIAGLFIIFQVRPNRSCFSDFFFSFDLLFIELIQTISTYIMYRTRTVILDFEYFYKCSNDIHSIAIEKFRNHNNLNHLYITTRSSTLRHSLLTANVSYHF